MHLNPVRVMRLGLGKGRQKSAKMGLAPVPTAEIVAARMAVLRGWRWSSYRVYVMARPLRIERVGGWYHLTARANERRAIFRDDRDRRRFLELLDDARRVITLRRHG